MIESALSSGIVKVWRNDVSPSYATLTRTVCKSKKHWRIVESIDLVNISVCLNQFKVLVIVSCDSYLVVRVSYNRTER